MFKKFILGLGLLGVVSSANAAYLKCGSTNQATYIEKNLYLVQMVREEMEVQLDFLHLNINQN